MSHPKEVSIAMIIKYFDYAKCFVENWETAVTGWS